MITLFRKSSFADDTQVFSDEAAASLDAASQTFACMQKNIGFTINYNKTTVHTIGGSRPNGELPGVQWSDDPPCLLGVDADPNSDQLFKILESCKNVLNQWHNRSLTLMGKVLVVNSLVASRYVHVMTCVNSPPELFYTKHDEMVRNFLWRGKRDKIPFKLLLSGKECGGLKLVNLKIRNSALKISWLFKTNVFARNIKESIAPMELGHDFWDCQLNSKHVKLFLPDWTPVFWKQVTEEWFAFTWGFDEEDPNRIRSQVLWCNSNILVENRPLYWKQPMLRGLVRLSDLFIDNVWKSAQTLENEFDLNWWQYNILRNAIPQHWIRTMKSSTLQNPPFYSEYDNLSKTTHVPRKVYNMLVGNNLDPLRHLVEKWNKHIKITQDELIDAFKRLYIVTNTSKYRDFQYRNLCCALPTNDRLYYWKKVPSQICERCGTAKQTYLHFFFYCKTANKIWSKLKRFLVKGIGEEGIRFSVKMIILGKVMQQTNHLANFIVLITMQCIYATKFTDTEPTIEHVLGKINEMYEIERFFFFFFE